MSGFCTDIWYVAGFGRDLKAGDMFRKEILGEPILLGRTAGGRAFAMRDICAHRAAPLSAGKQIEHQGATVVECPYHGWLFRTDTGACAGIPALPTDSDFEYQRIKVRSYPVRERDGLIWIWMPASKHFAGEPPREPPPFDLPGGGKIKIAARRVFPSTVDESVIGLIDPAHGPYVHRQWWWRTGKNPKNKEKTYAPSEHGFTMVAHPTSSNSNVYKLLGGAPTTEISFRLPGLRLERTWNDKNKIAAFTAMTPLGPDQTEMIQALYWEAPVLDVLAPLARPAVEAFLAQDAGILALQREGLKYDPPMLLVDDADALAKWYLRLKKEWNAAQVEGRPFQNPVEPATLRWRT